MDRHACVGCWYKPRGLTVILIVLFTCFKIITEFSGNGRQMNKDKGTVQGIIRIPKKAPEHRLAVLIPFRNCYEEMITIVPHLHRLLKKKNIDHQIYVINQADNLRFNRGQLINVGYLESRSECDYVGIHDVDLLPLNENLPYGFPKHAPMHLSPAGLHPRYSYPKFMGGVLLVNNEHFKMLNGFSNKYWGWGKEDDEFSIRMKASNLWPDKPKNITTGKRHTFRHIHDGNKRPRDRTNYFGQEKISFKRDYDTGINTTLYRITKKTNMHIDGAPLTLIDVHFKCDVTSTPWCLDQTQYDAVLFYLKNALKIKHREVMNKTLQEKYSQIWHRLNMQDIILKHPGPS